MPEERGPFELSPREWEVVALIARGSNAREIGAACGISAGTVKHHLTNAYEKSGTSDRLGLVLWSLRQTAPDLVELISLAFANLQAQARERSAGTALVAQQARQARIAGLQRRLVEVRRRLELIRLGEVIPLHERKSRKTHVAAASPKPSSAI